MQGNSNVVVSHTYVILRMVIAGSRCHQQVFYRLLIISPMDAVAGRCFLRVLAQHYSGPDSFKRDLVNGHVLMRVE